MSGTQTGKLWSRREVLGAAGALAVGSRAAAGPAPKARNLIFILCSGGPSQLDTWDPKPEAPAEIRGPYGALSTPVAGLRVSETLPRLARLSDRYAVVRSVHSEGPALHELGYQWVQTGRASVSGPEWPHFGAVVAHYYGSRGTAAGNVVLPQPLLTAGLSLPLGQHAGFLGAHLDPVIAVAQPGMEVLTVAARPDEARQSRRAALAPAARLASLDGGTPGAGVLPTGALSLDQEPEAARERFGRGRFGESCLAARRLVERGVRCVTINQHPSLFHTPSWDCHGLPDLPTRVPDLKDQVAAPFDQAVSALIEDLVQRGLYEETLVCCFGEFGRAPQINAGGGRDHWNRCWSVMLGGGGVRGGQVVGASDPSGAEPRERPVTPSDLAATIYAALGVPLDLPVNSGPAAEPLVRSGAPLRQLL